MMMIWGMRSSARHWGVTLCSHDSEPCSEHVRRELQFTEHKLPS